MSTKSRTSAKGLTLPSVLATSGAIRAVRAKYEGMGKTGNEIRKMWKQIIEEARELTKTVKEKVQLKGGYKKRRTYKRRTYKRRTYKQRN
jgi:hypothetical protein